MHLVPFRSERLERCLDELHCDHPQGRGAGNVGSDERGGDVVEVLQVADPTLHHGDEHPRREVARQAIEEGAFPSEQDHECEECGEPLGNNGCGECLGRVIRVTYAGYPGTYYDQPEDPEGVIWCPVCQEETDAYLNWTTAWCQQHDDEVAVPEPDDEGDDAYERAAAGGSARTRLGRSWPANP